MPLNSALAFGRIAGNFAYAFSSHRRVIALKNLKLAFPERSEKVLVRLIRKMFENFGMATVEILRIPKIARGSQKTHFSIEGEEFFRELCRERGIALGIHMGSWELLNGLLVEYFPYAVLARKQKITGLDRFLNELRLYHGTSVIFENELLKMAKYLREGYVLGLVFDHGGSDSDLNVPFFGKRVPVPAGALRLAYRFHKKIFPCALHRKSHGHHVLQVGAPLTIDSENMFFEYALTLHRIFEGYIRMHPEEYLWFFKRFKRSVDTKLLVLSDGKAGHLKQSQAIAEIVKTNFERVSVEEIEVSLTYLQRFFLNSLLGILYIRRKRQSRFFKIILGRQFDRIFRYADLVVSTGGALSSLNRIFSWMMDAKSINIFRPAIASQTFDLLFIPRHDHPANLKNLVQFEGAIVSQDIDNIERGKKHLLESIPSYSSDLPVLGIFLGGPVKGRGFSLEIEKLFSVFRRIHLMRPIQLFISTSRRTPSLFEEKIEQMSQGNPLVKIFISSEKNNFPFASESIMALSSLVIVTADSISMLTESCTLAPATIALNAFDRFMLPRKHGRFLMELEKRNHIASVTVDGLFDECVSVLLKNKTFAKLDNTQNIIESLKTII